jgi:hypothetical protein
MLKVAALALWDTMHTLPLELSGGMLTMRIKDTQFLVMVASASPCILQGTCGLPMVQEAGPLHSGCIGCS